MTPYDIWLNRIPGMGSRMILRLWRHLGCRTDFAQELFELDPGERVQLAREMLRGPGLSGSVGSTAATLRRGIQASPEQCMEELSAKGILCTCVCDPSYPERLRNIPDPPFALYYYGKLPSDFRPSAGIVGTRMASPYGREQTRLFARRLAENGIQIVSGMARGVDGVAGKAALDGMTDESLPCSFAVLGCGVDICYPKENLDLYQNLRDRGGVLSEYPPGTLPEARLFPSRNRIISGLSDVILVMEAREKSGTLITVDQALEQGKDIFALPGRVSDRNSRGCNNLIRQGAGIALSPETVLRYFRGGDEETPQQQKPQQLSFDFEALSCPVEQSPQVLSPRNAAEQGAGTASRSASLSLTRLERAVCDALDDSTPVSLDSILPQTERTVGRKVAFPELVRVMTRLAVRGLVREAAVGQYIRVMQE